MERTVKEQKSIRKYLRRSLDPFRAIRVRTSDVRMLKTSIKTK
jgi:hypothetical protein